MSQPQEMRKLLPDVVELKIVPLERGQFAASTVTMVVVVEEGALVVAVELEQSELQFEDPDVLVVLRQTCVSYGIYRTIVRRCERRGCIP